MWRPSPVVHSRPRSRPASPAVSARVRRKCSCGRSASFRTFLPRRVSAGSRPGQAMASSIAATAWREAGCPPGSASTLCRQASRSRTRALRATGDRAISSAVRSAARRRARALRRGFVQQGVDARPLKHRPGRLQASQPRPQHSVAPAALRRRHRQPAQPAPERLSAGGVGVVRRPCRARSGPSTRARPGTRSPGGPIPGTLRRSSDSLPDPFRLAAHREFAERGYLHRLSGRKPVRDDIEDRVHEFPGFRVRKPCGPPHRLAQMKSRQCLHDPGTLAVQPCRKRSPSRKVSSL